MNNIVYLNNQFVAENQATISIFDRGFLFADGVYEVIPVYKNCVLFLKEHLDRLQANLDRLNINHSLNLNQWQDICTRLISNNGYNRPIYIQITRGADKTRKHDFPNNLTPTVLALSLDPISPGDSLNYGKTKQLNIITLPDNRWDNCDVKSIALLGNILLRQEGLKQNAEEVLLIRKNGNIVEGTASNFFIVKNNAVITPPLSNEILPGITRQIVIKICSEHNVELSQSNINLALLESADEIWITSSTKEVRPVTKINDKLINHGAPGPIWQKVAKLYVDYIKQLSE